MVPGRPSLTACALAAAHAGTEAAAQAGTGDAVCCVAGLTACLLLQR